VREAVRHLIPMKPGDGASTVLIRICCSIIRKEREICICPRIDAHGSNSLRLLCAANRGPERHDGTTRTKSGVVSIGAAVVIVWPHLISSLGQ